VAKRRLLPFGEYLPAIALAPALHAELTGGEGISPGPAPQRIALGRRVIGVLNCFEDTLPEAGAELAGSDLLVNLTNDAWFDGANNDQHVLASRWRAVELRRDLVRASNAGRSAHVDALGAVQAVAPQGAVTVLRARPRVSIDVHALAPWVIVWGPRAALAALVVAWSIAARRERSLR
jgi:apolipoprotein N-acyltransferase